MNIVTQAHLTQIPLGAILTQIAAGVSTWASTCKVPADKVEASVVVTDNLEIANAATKGNNVVILISGQPETVYEGVIVCSVMEITGKVRDRLSLIEHQHSH